MNAPPGRSRSLRSHETCVLNRSPRRRLSRGPTVDRRPPNNRRVVDPPGARHRRPRRRRQRRHLPSRRLRQWRLRDGWAAIRQDPVRTMDRAIRSKTPVSCDVRGRPPRTRSRLLRDRWANAGRSCRPRPHIRRLAPTYRAFCNDLTTALLHRPLRSAQPRHVLARTLVPDEPERWIGRMALAGTNQA